jgi:ferrochelatase
MTDYASPDRRLGVLLVNLGTPASPRTADVRRFLRQFLADPRVVELSPWLWRPLLEGFILPLRAPRSAELYRQIWTADGSPLLVHTRRQCELLAQRLGSRFLVRAGMRYGSPSIGAAIEELSSAGCERIVLVPLFPQYSSSTTGTACAEAQRRLDELRAQPGLVTVGSFPTDRAYIEALGARVSETQASSATPRIDHYVASFHGLPRAYIDRGDPYLDQCRATSRALQLELGIEDSRWSLVFQSRFGPQAWLEPYAAERVPELARACKRVLIVMPGFAADCLETLEEIGIRLRAAFRAAGGEELLVVPALNDHPRWIEALANLVHRGTETPASAARSSATSSATRPPS